MDQSKTTPNKGRYLFWLEEEKNGDMGSLATIDAYNPWEDLENTFIETNTILPFIFSNPRLNYEHPFQLTCKKLNIPASIGTGYNLPWTLETLALLQNDTLVSTPSLLPTLLEGFERRFNKKLTVKNTIVVLSTSDTKINNLDALFIGQPNFISL